MTAISDTGLEGYPSRVRRLDIRSALIDRQGPVSTVIPEGYYKPLASGQLLIGNGTRLRLAARDDAVQVTRIEYSWDGENWITWTGASIPMAGQTLPATLQVRATDSLGKVGPIASVPFEAM